jgi:hypothetical protein
MHHLHFQGGITYIGLTSITGKPMQIYLQLYKYLRPGFVEGEQHTLKIVEVEKYKTFMQKPCP